jgi:hypothetical protein
VGEDRMGVLQAPMGNASTISQIIMDLLLVI